MITRSSMNSLSFYFYEDINKVYCNCNCNNVSGLGLGLHHEEVSRDRFILILSKLTVIG
jgi:hypothetical protein